MIAEMGEGEMDESKMEERIADLREKLRARLQVFYLPILDLSGPKPKKRKESKAEQKKRVQDFRAMVTQQAEELKDEPHGKKLLNTIGYVYRTKANIFMGGYEMLLCVSL